MADPTRTPGVTNTPVREPNQPNSPVRNTPVRNPGETPQPKDRDRKSAEDEDELAVFSADELHEMRGDLLPGELGWIELDEEGEPTGEVSRDIPERGKTVARVVGVLHSYDEVVTPSGAPLTRHMNPEPSLWDDGMLARNPVPEADRDPDKEQKDKEHDRIAKHLGLKK